MDDLNACLEQRKVKNMGNITWHDGFDAYFVMFILIVACVE